MNKIIAVDIDETCVDMWPMWLNWCNLSFNKNLTAEDVDYNYDLTQIFGKAAMTFWSDDYLYWKVEPKKDCVVVLKKLHEQGWNVGFVSYAKKGHFASKCDWVNQWFPFRDFIHCTKEKGFTRCTHFVDDRNKYLNQQPRGVTLLKMQTPYTQDETISKFFSGVCDWEGIGKLLIKETYEIR